MQDSSQKQHEKTNANSHELSELVTGKLDHLFKESENALLRSPKDSADVTDVSKWQTDHLKKTEGNEGQHRDERNIEIQLPADIDDQIDREFDDDGESVKEAVQETKNAKSAKKRGGLKSGKTQGSQSKKDPAKALSVKINPADINSEEDSDGATTIKADDCLKAKDSVQTMDQIEPHEFDVIKNDFLGPRKVQNMQFTRHLPQPFSLNGLVNQRMGDYNGLKDQHLQGFFYSRKRKEILVKNGLITTDGYIINRPEEYLKKKEIYQRTTLIKTANEMQQNNPQYQPYVSVKAPKNKRQVRIKIVKNGSSEREIQPDLYVSNSYDAVINVYSSGRKEQGKDPLGLTRQSRNENVGYNKLPLITKKSSGGSGSHKSTSEFKASRDNMQMKQLTAKESKVRESAETSAVELRERSSRVLEAGGRAVLGA